MNSEQQYIELYQQAREMIFSHAPEAMNAVRDEAFEDFRRQGFPSKISRSSSLLTMASTSTVSRYPSILTKLFVVMCPT